MATYQHISHGFDPVFNERSTVLVLGSFPSVLSRKNDFYYGNPQNRFWRVLAALAKAPLPETTSEKKEMLLSCGIALWDVIQECDIKGSSDASIKNVVPAQVEFITRTAPIKRVICNGATAGRLYKKYLLYKVGIEAEVLPSTSPANAAWGFDRLSERWLAALDGVRPATDDEVDSFKCERKSAKRAGKGEVEYAHVRIPAPDASSYAVHKSMQGNKRKDTKPELLVRQRLREAGLGGYRLQWKVPGTPMLRGRVRRWRYSYTDVIGTAARIATFPFPRRTPNIGWQSSTETKNAMLKTKRRLSQMAGRRMWYGNAS